jgi:hypothetical protein
VVLKAQLKPTQSDGCYQQYPIIVLETGLGEQGGPLHYFQSALGEVRLNEIEKNYYFEKEQ